MPVILLVIGFGSAAQLWFATIDSTVRFQHQTAIVAAAQALLNEIVDADAGARGYTLTARTSYLVPYTHALDDVPRDLEQLTELVAGDPIQMFRVGRIGVLGNRELHRLSVYVELRRAGQAIRALDEARIATKTRAMLPLQREIGSLESAAQNESLATLDRLKVDGHRTLYTLVCCIFFGIAFATVAAFRIRRAIRGRVDLLVTKAQRLAKGEDIGPQPTGGGTDEISELDRAFHHMAELLIERTGDLERYQLLAERTQCLMLFARQRDGRILHANAAALATYGYSLAEIRALTFSQLQSGELPASISERLTLPACLSVAYEGDQRRSDGSTFPAEVTVEGQLVAGENVQLSIIRDITERRRAESLVTDALGAAQNAAHAKTDFLAAMSHEIRTPMNAVIGMTELISMTELTPEQREAVQIVSDSGIALLRIIDDVLDFSKIEAGRLNVEILEFPFAKTIESVAVTLAAQARARGLALSVFVDPRAPGTLFGDAGRIRQVLTNLVGNALKFTPTGSVMLCADVASMNEEWCDVRFSVVDTGIGINPEQLSRIFEPFAQADASTTRVYGGSGLGLSICKNLVELMGGEIRAESAPDRGSTFSFVLRLRVGESKIEIERNELRALVVDAHGEAGSELSQYIRAWGIDVRVVASAAAAVATCSDASDEFRSFHFAIIDADWLGSEALQLASTLPDYPRSARARRFFVTSSDGAEKRAAAAAAGFDAYLVRPLRQSQLFDCIMNVSPVLSRSPAEPQNEPTGRRILLAEDNPVNQRVASQQLNKLGYEATVVDTGGAALAAVSGERYDLILMDCFMPEMDGYDATRAIRRLQAATGEHTPIIAMTANAQSGDRDTCIAAGMDDYLAKPVRLQSLRDVLERYCKPSDDRVVATSR